MKYEKSVNEAVKEYNITSMEALKMQDYGKALEILRKAETVCELSEKAKAMNYNNIACHYRK